MTSPPVPRKTRSVDGFVSIPADALVIPPYRRVPEKSAGAAISRFGDDVWCLDISIAALNVSYHERTIDFAKVPPKLRPLTKAYCWCALNFDHSGLATRLEPVTPQRLKREHRRFLSYCAFMAERRRRLKDATDIDHDAWMARFDDRSYSTRVRSAAVPQRVYWYRRHLPEDIFTTLPWEGREPLEILGKCPPIGENTTERVPRSVMDPMLRWALFYVEHAADDILRASRFPRHPARPARPVMPSGDPGFAVIPSTSVPWRHLTTDEPFTPEYRHLVAASYIVTAFFSGMRDGEVQAIEDQAWTVKRDAAGQPYRYLVESTQWKGETENGHRRSWIVLPEVHAALDRLSALAAMMNELSPDPPGTLNAQLVFRRYQYLNTGDAALVDQIGRWINEYQAHVNSLADLAIAKAPSATDRDVIQNLFKIPPTAEGQPWRWQTRQFRRTIAWYIANEPFGTVAGMRQFGHVREVTFQGYAGSPDAGFRDEIEKARAIGKMRDVIDLYHDVRDGARIGGPTGARLEREFREIAQELGDLPGKIVDQRRLHAMLKNVAKEVYPGLINDCFFDASTALCLRRADIKGHDKPNFARCDFEKCPNSCYWSKHRPLIAESLSEARDYRARPGLSKNQRTALDIMISQYSRALSRIESANQI